MCSCVFAVPCSGAVPERNQCTMPVRAERRDQPASGVGVGCGGWRVPGAWKADPVHCSEV